MFSAAQVRAFVADVIKETKGAEAFLPVRVREALLADRAFAACRGQACDSVEVATMDRLIGEMTERAVAIGFLPVQP